MSFKKGCTYIIYSEERKHWYLVRQLGMKTWIAINFTNTEIDQYDISMKHNGVELWNILKPRADYRCVRTNKELRHKLFDILQYGYFKD